MTETIKHYKEAKARRKAARSKFIERVFTEGTKFRCLHFETSLPDSTIYVAKSIYQDQFNNWLIECVPLNKEGIAVVQVECVSEIIEPGKGHLVFKKDDYRPTTGYVGTRVYFKEDFLATARSIVTDTLYNKGLIDVNCVYLNLSSFNLFENSNLYKSIVKRPRSDVRHIQVFEFDVTFTRKLIKQIKRWALQNQRKLRFSSIYYSTHNDFDGSEIFGDEDLDVVTF